MKDSKRKVKYFIEYICDDVIYKFKELDPNKTWCMIVSLNYDIAYLVADKGIAKRVERQLYKRTGEKFKVEYFYGFKPSRGFNGQLRIEKPKKEHYTIQIPKPLIPLIPVDEDTLNWRGLE